MAAAAAERCAWTGSGVEDVVELSEGGPKMERRRRGGDNEEPDEVEEAAAAANRRAASLPTSIATEINRVRRVSNLQAKSARQYLFSWVSGVGCSKSKSNRETFEQIVNITVR
jgi:hypothetical protein